MLFFTRTQISRHWQSSKNIKYLLFQSHVNIDKSRKIEKQHFMAIDYHDNLQKYFSWKYPINQLFKIIFYILDHVISIDTGIENDFYNDINHNQTIRIC